ncbi:MAG TPA: response regulator [Azospirillaceae bacterium]|nr:response regulator [Azospirillaceae bacterium]
MSVLAGRRILVVEDEVVVAMMVEDMLLDLGCDVVGPAARLDQGLQLAADEALDAAILDVNLNDRRSYPIAEELRRRGVPFLFATGYAAEEVRCHDAEAPIIRKPYDGPMIEAALRCLLSSGTNPEPDDAG